jgi:hypothetical protein
MGENALHALATSARSNLARNCKDALGEWIASLAASSLIEIGNGPILSDVSSDR